MQLWESIRFRPPSSQLCLKSVLMPITEFLSRAHAGLEAGSRIRIRPVENRHE